MSRGILVPLLLVALAFAVQAQNYYDCSSSCTSPNCLHFTGNEIGSTSSETFTWYNRTTVLTLTNWVLKTGSSNAYRCFDYTTTEGKLLCLEIETSNGIVHLNEPASSGQYCAPTTVRGRKTTEHTISKVSSRVTTCPLMEASIGADKESACTGNSVVHLSSAATIATFVTYSWKVNGVTVPGAAGTYSTYSLPAGLPAGNYVVSVTITNGCDEVETVSKTITIHQGPVISITGTNGAQSGTVTEGADVTLSWGVASGSGATFELVKDDVVIQTISGLSGTYLASSMVPGAYKARVSSTEAVSGCSDVKELAFTVVDPNAAPILTITYYPPLLNGNMVHKNCIYCMYWTATNVAPTDQMHYSIDGNAGYYIPSGYPGSIYAWWVNGPFYVNYSITNQEGKTGVVTHYLDLITDPTYTCPSPCFWG